MSPEAFAVGMALLAELYPARRDLSPMASDLYAETFRDVSDDVWMAGVKRACQTNTFFPVPAEIRVAINAVTAEAHGVNTPERAWEHVLAVARSWGPNQLVRDRFDTLTWQALAALGGIRSVALAEDGAGVNAVRRDFITAYERRMTTHLADVAVLPLVDTVTALTDGAVR